MAFEIRTATVKDVDSMAEVYLSAFASHLVSKEMFPRSCRESHDFWAALLKNWVHDKNTSMCVIDDPSSGPESSSPQVIAMAKWTSPGAPDQGSPPREVFPEVGNPDLAAHFLATLGESHRRNMSGQPHWYLELLAVRKGWMGKGAGGQLLRWGLEKADADGVACYLDATKEGRGMYEGSGFRSVGEVAFDTAEGQVRHSLMIRDARTR